MKRAKLDRGRPFGTVYGLGPVRFEQDNRQFDATGTEILIDAPPPIEKFEPPTTASPTVTDGLEKMTMAQLRARYTDLTGKRAKVGISKKALRQLIRDAE